MSRHRLLRNGARPAVVADMHVREGRVGYLVAMGGSGKRCAHASMWIFIEVRPTLSTSV